MKVWKRLCSAALSLGALACSSYAETLYDNGPLITHEGVGAGGADVSEVQIGVLSLNTYGFIHGRVFGSRVADDVVVPSQGWLVTGFVFYAYEPNSGTTSTINHVNVRIWNGAPGEGQIIAGDGITNVLRESVFSNIYRLLDTDTFGTTVNRPVMKNTVVLTLPVALQAGTYWIDWQSDGTIGNGPWCPPVTLLGQYGKPGANAKQYDLLSQTWSDAVDRGTTGTLNARQDLPFQVVGTNVNPDIPPTDYSFFRGQQEAGDLTSLFFSDDHWLVSRNGVIALPFESPITLRVSGLSPIPIPNNFRFRVENHVSITGLNQSIDLFDFLRSVYENQDVRSATTTDTVVTVTPANVGRFVETGSLAIKGQVRIKPAGPVFTNTWRSYFDQTVWVIS